MVLPVVGGVGQERLRRATVTAHSELAALYLAGAGFGQLIVPSETIANAVRALNPLVRVTVDPTQVDSDEPRAAVEEALRAVKAALEL